MNPVKYMAVTDELEKLILSRHYFPGSLLPSQFQLAAQFGISRSCAQKVVDELDARKLIDRVPGKGIFVREDSSNPGKFKKIAYLVPSYYRVSYSGMDNYGLDIMLGVEEKLRELGAQFIFYRYDEKKPGGLEEAIKNVDADGYVVSTLKLSDSEVLWLGKYAASNVIVVNRISDGVACVSPNFFDSFSQLIKRLLAAGRERLCFMYSSAYSCLNDIRALKSVYECSDIRFVDFSRPEISYDVEDDTILREMIFNVVEEGLPDVMLFFSDWPAMKSIKYLKEKGISVPDDLEVIGALNFKLAEISEPSLTTLAVEPDLIGKRAVELLHRMILEGIPPIMERIPMHLVERASTNLRKD